MLSIYTNNLYFIDWFSTTGTQLLKIKERVSYDYMVKYLHNWYAKNNPVFS